MIKDIIKNVVTLLKVKSNKICAGTKCYIGLNVKVVNRGHIKLEENVIIRPLTHIYANAEKSSIQFNSGTEIGRNSTISSVNKVFLGKNVLTGPHVFIADHNHEYRNPDIPISSGGGIREP